MGYKQDKIYLSISLKRGQNKSNLNSSKLLSPRPTPDDRGHKNSGKGENEKYRKQVLEDKITEGAIDTHLDQAETGKNTPIGDQGR